MGSSDDVDGGSDRVELRVWELGEFPDSEIRATLVESEPEMQFPDVVEGVGEKAECVVDSDCLRAIEDEVGLDEGDGLVGP